MVSRKRSIDDGYMVSMVEDRRQQLIQQGKYRYGIETNGDVNVCVKEKDDLVDGLKNNVEKDGP